MFENKIIQKKAKEMYRSSDCSTYVMARNNPNEYESYKKLNISRETELEWKSEMLEEYFCKLQKGAEKGQRWKVIYKMCELVESTKHPKDLMLIYKVIKNEMIYFEVIERVIISESIIGRSHLPQRSGLIFLSYDIGEVNLAKQFEEISRELLNVKNYDKTLENRIVNARRMIEEIKCSLFI
jgi:hypothetical protein